MLTLEPVNWTSCSYHRIALPFAHLDVTPKVPVHVFNRLPGGGGTLGLRAKKAAGVRLVMDLDDFWELPPGHYLTAAWNAGGTPTRITEALGLADVVMVTTETLAAQVLRFNRNVVVVPNALPFDKGQFTQAALTGDSLFVYAAGASHRPDIAPIAAALNRNDLTLAGVQKGYEWTAMRALCSACPTAEMRPVQNYMGLYDGHAVALAPLVDNLFNRCKSNLKALEAGAKGMPLIASRVETYAGMPGVLYAGESAEWTAQMDRCVREPTLAADAGAALAAFVREHFSLAAANEIRRQVLESFA